MRRLNAVTVLQSTLAALTGMAVLGCAENESTLFIGGVVKIGSDCVYPNGGEDNLLLPRGVYDIGFAGSYQAGLLVGNQMNARGQKSRVRTETSRILLEGAEVSLSLPTGGALMRPFSSPGAGFVDVVGGEGAGYGVLPVVLLPMPKTSEEAFAALDAGYVIAEVRAFGKTLGGKEVESNAFKFPIDVCEGCLVTFGSADVELNANNEVVCRQAGTEEASAPCLWGQDEAVSCSLCAASFSVCERP